MVGGVVGQRIRVCQRIDQRIAPRLDPRLLLVYGVVHVSSYRPQKVAPLLTRQHVVQREKVQEFLEGLLFLRQSIEDGAHGLNSAPGRGWVRGCGQRVCGFGGGRGFGWVEHGVVEHGLLLVDKCMRLVVVAVRGEGRMLLQCPYIPLLRLLILLQ
jgi:hypothetical protein